MTFLVDPPLLGLIGLALGARVGQTRRRNRIATVIVAASLLSVLLYLDFLPFWFGRWRAGSVWMLNSGLGTDLERTAGTDFLAGVILASYPMWTWVGMDVGRRLGRS